MFKKLSFLLIGLLFFASSVYAEDLSTSLKTSSAVYKNGYYENLSFNFQKDFLHGYYTGSIFLKDNYLFALGTTPSVGELFSSEYPYNPIAVPYAILNVFDLRNSEEVFSSENLLKDYYLSTKDKLTISDKYAFAGILRTTAPLTTKIYDISNLPEIVDKGFINIFPDAVSGNKAFMITGKGISGYDITDVNNPVLEGKYLKPNISNIETEGDRAYISYYNADKKVRFLEVLDINNFSFKKISKEYPLHSTSPYGIYFHVRANFVYVFDDIVKKFFVLDASNSENIKKIYSFDVADERFVGGQMVITGNYAVIIFYNDILILNISDPYNITVAYFSSYIKPFALGGTVEDITTSGKYVAIKYSFWETGGPGYIPPPEGDVISLYEITSFVDLANFDTSVKLGKTPRVILTWQTGSEDGVNKFYIMRKNKNINKKISSIAAKGTDLKGASYKIVDNTVKNGKTYKYQLFYRDTDGGDHLIKSIFVRVN